MTGRAEIFEVGPRDGLQNDPRLIATSDKIALVNALSRAGFRRIEVASFVSPRWVPQMADSAEVLAGIRRAKGVSYTALTPNMKGFERAVAARADEVAIFVSASEGFSRANLNASIDATFERYGDVAEGAKAAALPVRGYISCVTDCPYDGPTPPSAVASATARLFELGAYEVSLGDTIGRGTPEAVTAMLAAVLDVAPPDRLAGHFHDTSGRALENVDAALDAGLRVFDASAGGLGGCPFAPGAAGNVATEAVQAHLERRGFDTGLDRSAVAHAADLARSLRGQADA